MTPAQQGLSPHSLCCAASLPSVAARCTTCHTHARRCWCTGEAAYTCGTSPCRSVPSLAWDRVFARSVVGGCAHQLYRCREGWRRASCEWVDAVCWCSTMGDKRAGNPSDGTRASEAWYGGGRCGDRSVRTDDRPRERPWLQVPPRSTERRSDTTWVWALRRLAWSAGTGGDGHAAA